MKFSDVLQDFLGGKTIFRESNSFPYNRQNTDHITFSIKDLEADDWQTELSVAQVNKEQLIKAGLSAGLGDDQISSLVKDLGL